MLFAAVAGLSLLDLVRFAVPESTIIVVIKWAGNYFD